MLDRNVLIETRFKMFYTTTMTYSGEQDSKVKKYIYQIKKSKK